MADTLKPTVSLLQLRDELETMVLKELLGPAVPKRKSSSRPALDTSQENAGESLGPYDERKWRDPVPVHRRREDRAFRDPSFDQRNEGDVE